MPLTTASVRDQATTYLSSYAVPSHLDDVVLGDRTGSPDGASATVELRGRVRLPIGGAVMATWRGGVLVTVTSTARTTLAP